MNAVFFLASLLVGIDLAWGNRVCNLAAHIKENVRWTSNGHKDPYGETTADPPLPHIHPFTTNTSAEINKQINRELFAHYTYLSMAMHFDRDDINLPGFHKFFKESAEEEMKHAQLFMKYQNKRGGRVKLHHVMTPCKDEWGDGLDAMDDALLLEKEVYQSLLDLHTIGHENDDPQLQDFLDSNYLEEQVDSIKELSNYVNILKRMKSSGNYALAEYQFDKITLGGGKE